MPNIDDKIKDLELKLKQSKALKSKIEAQKRTAAQKINRAQDTRRKILVGAMFLDRAQSPQQIQQLHDLLAQYLTRPDDRALFELMPLPAAAGSPGHATGS